MDKSPEDSNNASLTTGQFYSNFVKSNTGDINECNASPSYRPDPQKCDKLIDEVFNQKGVRGKLILYDTGTLQTPLSIIQNSLSNLELQCTIELDIKTQRYKFLIGNEVICNASHIYENKQVAKHELAKEAFEQLMKHCFLLKRKRDHTDVTGNDLNTDKKNISEPQFDYAGSVAHKMMLNMGWSGGGLGSQEQGRIDNVQVYENIDRRGFGNKNILKEVTKILRDFSNSNKFTILAFDSSFTKEEREAIHKTARRLNLKSKSEGKGDERRITVSRKINRWDIVRELLKEGGESSSYSLRIPDNFRHIIE